MLKVKLHFQYNSVFYEPDDEVEEGAIDAGMVAWYTENGYLEPAGSDNLQPGGEATNDTTDATKKPEIGKGPFARLKAGN
jgi:hypothetical protein